MPLQRNLEDLTRQEERLPYLLELCREDLGAEEVWLFGSRARGDNRPDSDWDFLVVVGDDVPEEALDPVRIWQVGRASGVLADLLTVRRGEFNDSQDAVTTLSYIARKEGVRLDV